MPPIRAPANLPSLVKTAFGQAKATGDLTYFPTQVALLKLNSVQFQLRFSPALASKPKGPPPSDEQDKKDEMKKDKKAFNPFENPLPSMTVVKDLAPSHALVLNKFAIVPEHFILITRQFKPQTHVLESDDLAAALACVRAYKEDAAAASDGDGVSKTDSRRSELFVFFNSGPHSGASQPHRHLQLLPVEQMRTGLDGDAASAWNVLAEGSDDQLRDLPFAILREAITPDTTAEELHAKYVSLYRRAARLALAEASNDIAGQGEAQFSYNMAMTDKVIALCPRAVEGAPIVTGRDGGRELGHVALNGTLLAGTALVKTQELYDAIKQEPALLFNVLEKIGFKPREETVLGNL
ncbi:hypothetical protein PFICI_11514 [Pestalotiopsis fici W106-1]|uniref:Uncharacterized protein n=1 Tax=Pestalotiopsis fici (strain W106-1 / CGMCC3.15140) TaxID=1229662 RepID=W3WSI6_PESFW|nr:uncharacterized protein PFICI_11514 [Pestalotiopsis fici W106-1]ETS76127.1 hypothetical protein PFICI_11514 [Pestalotiopsis fici W106-1]